MLITPRPGGQERMSFFLVDFLEHPSTPTPPLRMTGHGHSPMSGVMAEVNTELLWTTKVMLAPTTMAK